ncbi:MAG TPA: hypothetical protein VG603_04705 [Chitinophagales bacterium]|nr:hypothetical protein [Chitinophagales bacterium]
MALPIALFDMLAPDKKMGNGDLMAGPKGPERGLKSLNLSILDNSLIIKGCVLRKLLIINKSGVKKIDKKQAF